MRQALVTTTCVGLSLCGWVTNAVASRPDAVLWWAAAEHPTLRKRLRTLVTHANVTWLDISAETQAARPPQGQLEALMRQGLTAYEELRFDDAIAQLTAVIKHIDASGAAELSNSQLADVFLYRALTFHQRSQSDAAWDDLTIAAQLAPARVLDPARFAPKVIDQYARAQRVTSERPRTTLRLAGPGACDVRLDGNRLATNEATLAYGPHWLAVHCPGLPPTGQRLTLSQPHQEVPLLPTHAHVIDDANLLVQARAVSAKRFIAIAVVGQRYQLSYRTELGALRESASFGPEQTPALEALLQRWLRDEPLAPRGPVAPAHWYQNRWLWLGAGVALGAAVILPFALTDEPSSFTLQPSGVP